ncbi:unnamed protein product, partial [Mesorhabditis spiculigera]
MKSFSVKPKSLDVQMVSHNDTPIVCQRANLVFTIIANLCIFCCLALIDDLDKWNTILITLLGVGLYPFQIRQMLLGCRQLDEGSAWIYRSVIVSQFAAEAVFLLCSVEKLSMQGQELIFCFEQRSLIMCTNFIGAAGMVNAVGLATIYFSKQKPVDEDRVPIIRQLGTNYAEADKLQPLLIGLAIYPFQIRQMLVDCQELGVKTAWVYPGFIVLQIIAETIVFILSFEELGTRDEHIVFSFQKQGLVLIVNLIGRAGMVNAVGLITIHFSREGDDYQRFGRSSSISTICGAEADKSTHLLNRDCCKIDI